MKKKITAIFLCVALVAIAVVGASLAYFTDTKSATNTFTMGDVKIKLDETNVTEPTGDRVTSNAYDVYPGAVVTKDPIVHNVGKNAAYIRATVNVSNWMNLVAACYPDFKETFPNDGYKAALNLLVGELGEGWSVYPAVGFTANDIGKWAAGLNIGGGFDFEVARNWDLSAGLKWQPMFDDWRKNPVVISIGAAYKF